MSFIEEFRRVGLIKPKAMEAYVDKDTEQLIKVQNKMETGAGGMGGTTTANVPTTVQPFKSKEEEDAEAAQEEPKTVDEEEQEKVKTEEARKLLLQKCSKLAESAAKLAEAYEEITGEKLHEMYCPNCKPYNISPASPDQGVPFGPRVPGGKGSDWGDHPMANDYNR